jgi:hypothetical protein
MPLVTISRPRISEFAGLYIESIAGSHLGMPLASTLIGLASVSLTRAMPRKLPFVQWDPGRAWLSPGSRPP